MSWSAMRSTLAICFLLVLPAMALAQEHCTLGVGYPVSGRKLVMTQVAHHMEEGGEESAAIIERLERQGSYSITSKPLQVVIVNRSGALVRVHLEDKADVYWTISRAVTCY